MKYQTCICLAFFILFMANMVFAEDSRLFWVDKSVGKIQSATPGGTNVTDVATGLQMPECVAIDTTSTPMKIYCTEAGASRIIRMNFDGSGLEEVVTGISGLEDLELDMANRKVYWLTDLFSEDKVQRADMDSINSNIETLYTNSYAMHRFHGIGIHPAHQWVFWTQYVYGGLDRINRINYDGTGRINLGNYTSPNDLEIVGEKIYWIWGPEDLIMEASLDGADVDTVLTGVYGHFFAIDTLLGQIFWTEPGVIKCANLDNSGHLDLISGLSSSLTGIAIYFNPLSSISLPEDKKIGEYYLAQNYPNPFNPVTRVRFNLPRSSEVNLDVYDILGQKVSTIISGKLPAGEHEASWDAGNYPSGLYFYKLTAGTYQEVRKMLLVR